MSETRIAIVGDYDPTRETHRATDAALRHAADSLGLGVTADWIPTEALEPSAAAMRLLERYHAVFLGPGAPYGSQEGAFAAVRFAREQGRPFFGT